MPLNAITSPADRARSTRLLIAYLDGDRFAFDHVLSECAAEPTGTPGVLFAMIDFTAGLGDRVVPHFRDELRAMLLADQRGDGPPPNA